MPELPEVETAEPRGSLRERWAPLGLVLAGGFWNFLVTPLGDSLDEEDWSSYPLFAAFGLVYVQPALCAVWAALSTQSWIWRLPAGTAASLFLTLTMYGLGDLMDALVFMSMLYLLCLGGLVIVRWKFKTRLGTAGDLFLQPTRSSSYGMRYLFLWMSVAALLAGMGKMQAVGSDNWTLDIAEIAIWMLAFVLIFLPPVWLCAYLLRREMPRLFGVIISFLVAPIVSLVSCYLMWQWEPSSSFWQETYVPFTLLSLGAMLGVVMVATVLRWGGYRIYRITTS